MCTWNVFKGSSVSCVLPPDKHVIVIAIHPAGCMMKSDVTCSYVGQRLRVWFAVVNAAESNALQDIWIIREKIWIASYLTSRHSVCTSYLWQTGKLWWEWAVMSVCVCVGGGSQAPCEPRLDPPMIPNMCNWNISLTHCVHVYVAFLVSFTS